MANDVWREVYLDVRPADRLPWRCFSCCEVFVRCEHTKLWVVFPQRNVSHWIDISHYCPECRETALRGGYRARPRT